MATKTTEDFLWGALIGGAIGAATALMFAPLSGEKLRKKIKDGFPDLEIYQKPPQRPHQKPHHARKQAHNFKPEDKVNDNHDKNRRKPNHQSIHSAKKPKPK